MENELFVSVLFDYYSDLLTERQKDIFDLYVNQNLSLSEIAENLGISRQGVRDSLVKSENALVEFEEKLCIHKKNQRLSQAVNELKEILSDIKMTEEKKNRINSITDLIDELI